MRYQNDLSVAEAKGKKKAAKEEADEQESDEAEAATGDEKGQGSDEVKEKGANEAGDDGEDQDSDGAKAKAETDAEVENEQDSVAADGNRASVSTNDDTVEANKSSASEDEKSEDNKPSFEPASSGKPKTSNVAEVASIVSKIKPRDRESLSEEQMRNMDNPSVAAPHLADNRTLEQNPFMHMMMDRITSNSQMTGGVNYHPMAMPLRRASLPDSMMPQGGEDSNGFFPPHQYRKVSAGDISEGVSNRSSIASMAMGDSMMRRASSSSMKMSKEDEEEFERFMFLKRKGYADMERGGGA